METDLCGRCLVIPNTAILVRAKFPDRRTEIFANPTSPIELRKWAEERAYGDSCTFEIGETQHRILPFATRHGDPVCAYHLWVLADAEMKNGYRARALRAG